MQSHPGNIFRYILKKLLVSSPCASKSGILSTPLNGQEKLDGLNRMNTGIVERLYRRHSVVKVACDGQFRTLGVCAAIYLTQQYLNLHI